MKLFLTNILIFFTTILYGSGDCLDSELNGTTQKTLACVNEICTFALNDTSYRKDKIYVKRVRTVRSWLNTNYDSSSLMNKELLRIIYSKN